VTLTACIIARNEAGNLPRCLQSIRQHVDEVVVVDTGSADDTPMVARKHGADVVASEPHRTVDIGDGFQCLGDFADARNRSIELASGTHVLIVDADHVFMWPTFAAIKKAISDDTVHAAALRYHIASGPEAKPTEVVNGRKRIGPPFSSVAVFRKHPTDTKIYDGIIHETGTLWLKRREAEGTRQVTLIESRIADYGHNATTRDAGRKDERNERMLQRAITLDPTNPVPFSYLALTLCNHGKFEDAADVLECTPEDDPRLAGSHLLRFVCAKGLVAYGRGDPGGVWGAARGWEQRGEMDHPDIDTLKGLACEMMGKQREARVFYARACDFHDPNKFTSQHFMSTARDRLNALNAAIAN
jgi:hypothetical protein